MEIVVWWLHIQSGQYYVGVVWWLHIQSGQYYVGVSCVLVGCEHQNNMRMFPDISDLNKALCLLKNAKV